MKSRAAIGNHPVHPALVSLPIGAFFLVLVGDIAHARTDADFWYAFSFVCLGAGILMALVAAIAGFVDYFGVRMSDAGFRAARIHMVLNLTGVVLYTSTGSCDAGTAPFTRRAGTSSLASRS
jgi:Predicted membrane protein